MRCAKSLFGWREFGWLLMVSFALAGGWWWRLQVRKAQAEGVLAAREQMLAALWREVPGPSEANETAVQRDLLAATTRLQEERLRLTGQDEEPLAPETYFALAAAVAEWRSRANQAQVGIGAHEWFGFASYAEAGPPAELALAVRRQRVRVRPVIEALLASQPRQLHSVQRQDPRVVNGVAARSEPADAAGDFFAWTGPARLTLPAGLESDLFRCEFSGTTQTLRVFLTALAAAKPLVLVREVAVAPDDSTRRPPLIAAPASRFTVVLECLAVSATTPEGSLP